MNELQELAYDEMVNTGGGFAQLTAGAVAAGLVGFGAGVIIGLAVTVAVIYLLK